MFELLRHSGIISHSDKERNFDRMFPNQDFHSGKGLGNLIALPLNGKSIEHGNTCYLNPDTFMPYENQYAFLESIEKVPATKLRGLFEEFFDTPPLNTLISSPSTPYGYELEIIIQNQIFLKRKQLSKKLITFLREQLNFYHIRRLLLSKPVKKISELLYLHLAQAKLSLDWRSSPKKSNQL